MISGSIATHSVSSIKIENVSIAATVVDWLRTLKVSSTEYKINKTADATIFTSCFALFILDLFCETDKFNDSEREGWISYIQSYQDETDGYFKLRVQLHQDQERSWHQLTCFCISALGILGSVPLFRLRFLEKWQTQDDVRRYLLEQGCHEGRHSSGNKAMFLAIFMTYEFERTGDQYLRRGIEAWFNFHDEHQNSHGFWGNNLQSKYMHGMQNGFHQFEIYFYWKRHLQRLAQIVDVGLMMQDRDGFFGPTPGGDACHDYDTIHTLVTAHRLAEYRNNDIADCLKKAAAAIRSNQNSDGGFCQSRKQVCSRMDLMRHFPFYFSGHHPYLWYYRARRTFGVFLRKEQIIQTGWTKEGRAWADSNLWDTWFRCLALAEIESVLPCFSDTSLRSAKFHKTIGLGYFNPQK